MPPSKPRDGREFVRMAVDHPRHPKLLDTSDVARCGWLHFCSVAYCRENRTDGVVREDAMTRYAAVPARLAAELVRVGLWHRPGHDCERCVQPPARHVVVHDYGDHNQTRDEIEKLTEAGRAGATARWNRDRAPAASRARSAASNADRTTESDADRISGSHSGTSTEVEVEVEANPLLAYVGRLAGGDARDVDGLPAETVAAWQDRAGAGVDLVAEARAYLAWAGDRPARNPRAAWLGWLDKARDRVASSTAAAERRAACTDPECSGGWLAPVDDDRPRPCRTCRPHIRPAEEAS